ncbi:WG repeat-containing protein [Moraxella ovis]|uniref:WG repeat-containing protein n=1 Tax=Moraxella ovis TaxID=29433 RepID=UPI001C655EE4|nr:WG repeat-containing protein [Moraxella ovis]
MPLSALACEKPKVTGYDDVGCLHGGLAKVEQNEKYGFIDKTGKVVIPVQYDEAGSFQKFGKSRSKQ